MSNKTLLLQGITPSATTGNPATEAALDITEKVIGVFPALETPTITSQFFSTIVTTIVEGKAKYEINVKTHINRYNTTDGIHKAGSVGGATDAAVTLEKFKKSRKTKYDFTLNQSWDAGFIYDKKKDPFVREAELINDLGSVLMDKNEQQAKDFYTNINTEIGVGAAERSKTYSKYASSIDGLTKESPVLNKIISIATTPSDLDSAKLDATKIVDAMFNQVTEIALMGRAGSAHAGFPMFRGTRQSLTLKFIVKENIIPIISKDERFIQAGMSPEMIKLGMIGMINNVPVIQDDMMDANSNHDWLLVPTGQYGAVIIASELVDGIAIVDHPTKPTRASITDASGGWDSHVPPFINLSRTGKINLT